MGAKTLACKSRGESRETSFPRTFWPQRTQRGCPAGKPVRAPIGALCASRSSWILVFFVAELIGWARRSLCAPNVSRRQRNPPAYLKTMAMGFFCGGTGSVQSAVAVGLRRSGSAPAAWFFARCPAISSLGTMEGDIGEVGLVAAAVSGEQSQTLGHSMSTDVKIRKRERLGPASLAIGAKCLRGQEARFIR